MNLDSRTPQVHYKDAGSRGRGQLIRLLFEDAGVAYIDVRYPAEEWPEAKRSHPIITKNPAGHIPVVEFEVDGEKRVLMQSYAMARYFGRVLGKYDGETEEERYWADALCDIIIDCECLRSALSLLKCPSTELVNRAHIPQSRN